MRAKGSFGRGAMRREKWQKPGPGSRYPHLNSPTRRITSKSPRTYACHIREWRVLRAQVTCVRACVPAEVKTRPRASLRFVRVALEKAERQKETKDEEKEKEREREREREREEKGNRLVLTIIIKTSDPSSRGTCLSSSRAGLAALRYARFPVSETTIPVPNRASVQVPQARSGHSHATV